MKINDFLSPTDIMVDLRASDKSHLLRRLSAHAAAVTGLDPEEVSTQIAKREELGSTGVGNGVALPHARFEGLAKPFGLVARLHRRIDFEAIDDQPVDIIFLLLLPSRQEDAQLNVLACVARTLRDPAALHRIRGATDREGLFRAITNSGAV